MAKAKKSPATKKGAGREYEARKAAQEKAAPKKESKPRAEHYETKLAINGSFSDVIGVAMKPKKETKK